MRNVTALDVALMVVGGALVLYGIDSTSSTGTAAAGEGTTSLCLLLGGAADLAAGLRRVFFTALGVK